MFLLPAMSRGQVGTIGSGNRCSLRVRFRNRSRRFFPLWPDNTARRGVFHRWDRWFCQALVFAPIGLCDALPWFPRPKMEHRAELFRNFNEFEPVSPWILCVKPAHAGKLFIIEDSDRAGPQRLAQFIQMSHREGRVRFFRWPKIPLHANVHLLRSALEPAATACK